MALIGSSKVIVKRFPLVESVQDSVSSSDDVEYPCDCIDEIFNVPSPTCKNCHGTGIIRVNMVTEQQVKTRVVSSKKTWVTLAKIVIDNIQSVIFDEEDDIYISDVHVFLSSDEDIMVGDVIIPSGQQVAYKIVNVRDVRDINNVIMKDCAADIYTPDIG